MRKYRCVILLISKIVWIHLISTNNCKNLATFSTIPMIPSIVHMIMMDNRSLSQHTFLSIMTVFSIIKPKILFILTIQTPFGPYWSILQTEYFDYLVIRNITEPISIFSHTPKPEDYAYKSDIVRMNILKQMGGIYMDTDIVV